MRNLLSDLCALLPEPIAFALRALWADNLAQAAEALRAQAERGWRMDASPATILVAQELRATLDPGDPLLPLLGLIVRDRLENESLRMVAVELDRVQAAGREVA